MAYYAHTLNNIPNFITYLTLAPNFNEPLQGRIPPTVTHLIIDTSYQLPLHANSIPPTVTHFIFTDTGELRAPELSYP